MNLVIDTEFDGFFGELISMALVEVDGDREFYEVIYREEYKDPWVEKNVVPVLNKDGIGKADFQLRLKEFLTQSPEPITIYADWPDDIRHFCEWIITGPGYCINTPSITFHMEEIDYVSRIPHNALEDARAIKENWFKQIKKR